VGVSAAASVRLAAPPISFPPSALPVLPARRAPLRALLLCLALVGAALAFAGAVTPDRATSTITPPAPLAWRNPVIATDFPDPSIVRDGTTYWATSTSSATAPGFPLMRSTDLIHWAPVGQIFTQLPGWAADSFWAPEIFIDGDGVRVYYSARRRGGRLCVAVASAPVVTGPYTDHGPLVCQPAGSIDPTRTRDARGRLFLVWKEDGNAVGHGSTIWRQQMTPDGLRLIGRPRALLTSRDRWEGTVVEAPSIVVHGGWTYLFYSGNSYAWPGCRYALGVARARSIIGPFRRAPDNPILRSTGAWRCPGHAGFTGDDAGHTFLMYHAYTPARPGERDALLARVRWGRDGWPAVVTRG
jgi:beta-xylosidase